MKENTYLEKMVMTASPAKLVQMLYEKAIEVLKEAENLLADKKFVEFNEKVTRAQDIITSSTFPSTWKRVGRSHRT